MSGLRKTRKKLLDYGKPQKTNALPEYVIAYPDDGEIEELTGSISGMLKSAGWELYIPNGEYNSPPLFDVWVEVQQAHGQNVEPSDLQAADALIDFLHDNRIPVGGPMGTWLGETKAGNSSLI